MTDTGELTAAEAAEKLGLSLDQLYRRIHSGRLRARQTHAWRRNFMIDAAAIREYLDNDGQINVDALKMLRVSQVAELTGFSRETVRDMCVNGDLDYVRGPAKNGGKGQYRITRESVDRFLKNRQN